MKVKTRLTVIYEADLTKQDIRDLKRAVRDGDHQMVFETFEDIKTMTLTEESAGKEDKQNLTTETAGLGE